MNEAKYEAWKVREANRPSKAEVARIRKLYAKLDERPKPEPQPEPEPEQEALFDYTPSTKTNGHTR